MGELVVAGKIYKEGVSPKKLLPSDEELIRARIKACREYLEKRSKLDHHRINEKLHIYEFFGYGSYILTEKKEIGEKFKVPLKWTAGRFILEKDEWDFLCECEINENGKASRRLSPTEMKIFSYLCERSSIKSREAVKYSSLLRKLGKDVNKQNTTTLRSQVMSIRKKIKTSTMDIQTISGFGYKFTRKKSISS